MPRALEGVVARDLVRLPLLRVILQARLVRLRALHVLRLRTARLVAGMVALLGIGVRGARAGIAMRACLSAIAALLRDLARVVA